MEKRKVDTRESLKVVTKNEIFETRGLEKLSLKARKLLYVAISQCKKNDNEFFEYELTVQEFARLMEIAPSNVYAEADKLTDELMNGFVVYRPEGVKGFKKYSLFAKCEYYDGGSIYFKISPDMTDFFLKINRNFTQPLLADFLKMSSPYSMAIWHLMQREMKSQKVMLTDIKEFDLTVAELRAVTGCEKKLSQIGQFKERVLNKAIREIRDNCGVNITYKNVKRGRTIVGFHFYAMHELHFSIDNIRPEILGQIAEFKRRQNEQGQTIRGEDEQVAGQMSLFK